MSMIGNEDAILSDFGITVGADRQKDIVNGKNIFLYIALLLVWC